MTRGIPLTLALLTACSFATEPKLPAGAVPFDPPGQYRIWWEIVQECSGRTGDIQAVSWYRVPGTNMLPQGSNVTGVWFRKGNAIVLADGSVMTGEVVRHEMLHALLQGGGHPREAFQTGCGGIVSCGADCQADGGGAIPLPGNLPRVGVSDLEFTVQVRPGPHLFERDSGRTSVIVTATNPSDRDVRVPISSLSFGIRVQPEGEAAPIQQGIIAHGTLGFAAGTSHRKVFDLLLAPGGYTVEARFSRTPVAVEEYRVE